MDIREIDVFDDAVFHRFYEIGRDAELYERPDAPIWSEHEEAVMFRVDEDSDKMTAYAGFDGGEMVGTAFLGLPLLDNTNMSWLGVYVAPENRRRGIGGELLEFLVDKSHELGRHVLIADAAYAFDRREDHPYRRFAEKHGFALASTEVSRQLKLPVDEAKLDGWINEAAPYHSAYRIQTYVGDLPEHIVPSFCYVTNQLAVDAPSGDIEFEAEGMTPEAWRQREAKLKQQERTLFNTVALDTSGDAVAVSTLAVPATDRPKVYQWATLVLREHRGHRLGLAVKARNLLELQRAHPDRRLVHTQNAETNAQMVAINEKMGFRPVELSVSFQRKL